MARLVETRPEPRARGLVSDPSLEGRVQVGRHAPSPALRDVAMHHWVGRWSFPDGESHTTLLLADPCVNVVFERGGPHAGSRVVGVWTKLWRRTLEGDGLVRGMKLRPGAVQALFDRSAHLLRDRITPLTEVVSEDARALERAVLEPDDDAEALAALEGWATSRLRAEALADASLAVAIAERVTADASIVRVEQLSEVAGVSIRPLQRLFRAHLGASPKWVIRRNRLQEAAARLERGEATQLSALAVDLGYADHAHFARDFKNAVGESPAAFRARLSSTC